MERAVLVYTTWPSIVEAERAIVERRLAACVNILPGMVSHYWWQGKIERAEEVVMLVKTRAGLADAVGKAVKAAHSYTTPSIMVMPATRTITAGSSRRPPNSIMPGARPGMTIVSINLSCVSSSPCRR